MPDPILFIILLVSLGVLGVAAIFFAYYRRVKGLKKAKGPVVRLDLESDESASQEEAEESATEEELIAPERPSKTPEFTTLQKRPWAFADLFRALLILLSLVVALGFILILLPQPNIDRMAVDLRSRYGVPLTEAVALLYLGDSIQDNEFRIRGVVRNITPDPLEKLDAAVRFYAHDGTILQTTIVRMSKEIIESDEIASLIWCTPIMKENLRAMRYSSSCVREIWCNTKTCAELVCSLNRVSDQQSEFPAELFHCP